MYQTYGLSPGQPIRFSQKREWTMETEKASLSPAAYLNFLTVIPAQKLFALDWSQKAWVDQQRGTRWRNRQSRERKVMIVKDC